MVRWEQQGNCLIIRLVKILKYHTHINEKYIQKSVFFSPPHPNSYSRHIEPVGHQKCQPRVGQKYGTKCDKQIAKTATLNYKTAGQSVSNRFQNWSKFTGYPGRVLGKMYLKKGFRPPLSRKKSLPIYFFWKKVFTPVCIDLSLFSPPKIFRKKYIAPVFL